MLHVKNITASKFRQFKLGNVISDCILLHLGLQRRDQWFKEVNAKEGFYCLFKFLVLSYMCINIFYTIFRHTVEPLTSKIT